MEVLMRRRPSCRWRVEENIQGGDLPVADDDNIDPSIARRLAGWSGAPGEAAAILNGLRRAMRRVDKARMTGPQHAGDLI